MNNKISKQPGENKQDPFIILNEEQLNQVSGGAGAVGTGDMSESNKMIEINYEPAMLKETHNKPFK